MFSVFNAVFSFIDSIGFADFSAYSDSTSFDSSCAYSDSTSFDFTFDSIEFVLFIIELDFKGFIDADNSIFCSESGYDFAFALFADSCIVKL